jgi:NAD(P)-dependent dehydrogenase (short-subunit alcohol dehydrogenase family)
VVVGWCDAGKGEDAARRLGDPNVLPRQLDVSDDESVGAAASWAAERFGRCDALVNNAAILYDTWARAESADLVEVRVGVADDELKRLRSVAAGRSTVLGIGGKLLAELEERQLAAERGVLPRGARRTADRAGLTRRVCNPFAFRCLRRHHPDRPLTAKAGLRGFSEWAV